MLQNPQATKKTIDFYNQMKLENKFWYDYLDKYNFVLIAEKPSQIKALRAVLPNSKNIKIVSLAGHIMRLKSIEEYDVTLKDKSWFQLVKNNVVPYIPDT